MLVEPKCLHNDEKKAPRDIISRSALSTVRRDEKNHNML